MTKADLVMEVAKQTSLPKKESETVIKTKFGSISEALGAGDKVELRRFGSFRFGFVNPDREGIQKKGIPLRFQSKRSHFSKQEKN